MLFFNSAAPTGWTKQTTHNDKAIRLVTGTPSTGGSSAFSTVFGKTATDATTITTGTMPSHTHSTPAHAHGFVSRPSSSGGSGNVQPSNSSIGSGSVTSSTNTDGSGTSGGAGSDGGHTHPIDIRVQYVDAIICNKD
jgi:hypothetical protein